MFDETEICSAGTSLMQRESPLSVSPPDGIPFGTLPKLDLSLTPFSYDVACLHDC